MKKNKIITSICASFLAFGSLSLAMCSSKEEVNQENVFTTDDPVIYDDKDNTLVPYEALRASDEEPDPSAIIETLDVVKLHYLNDDGRCNSRRFYTWVDGLDGVERAADTHDTVSMDITLNLEELNYKYDPITGKHLTALWFIIKFGGTWAGQSDDIKIDYATYAEFIGEKEDGLLELWLIPGEGNAIEICTNEEETKIPKISTAKFTDWKTIHCVSSADAKGKGPVSYKLYAFDANYLNSDAASQVKNKEYYLMKEKKTPTSDADFDIKLNYTARINVQYLIESYYEGYTKDEGYPARKVFVSFENLYKTTRFNEHYNYSGNDLGVTYTKEKTTFKVWSPISAAVTLKLYLSGKPAANGGSDAGKTTRMFYTGNGVWEVSIAGDMTTRQDRFYNYLVTNPNGTKIEAVDPYAKAVGYNGIRGYIYDKDSQEANPTDWDKVPSIWNGTTGYDIKNPQELTVYEVHVRDLTMDESWGGTSKPGTFDAFSEKGTRYAKGSADEVTTGFDHIEELGVNAVQLLPVFDYDNEEDYNKYKFNWGYNPLNYNCVEGAYSSDPEDPLARIREYKNLIKEYALNKNHTRIIMDVVYNHVSSAPNSCFTKIMPKYYFRYNSEWAYTAGSGCANDVRTEAPMMRKYIVDSLCWWASEYKIKGFRFDLMGLIDTETIRAARDALTKIDPDIYIYGEGWSSGGTIFDEGATGTTTENVYSMLYNTNGYVGCFNDEGRNAIRGGNDSGWAEKGNKYPTWGFVSNGKYDAAGKANIIFDLIKGYHSRNNNGEHKGANPNQMIAYASCHDNYTVYDQLRYCLATKGYNDKDEMATGYSYQEPLRPKSGGEPDISELVSASIMAHGIVMASNGVAFMQGGEELYRTKTITDVDIPSQGVKATPEYKELTKGGDEAIVRPFPAYMNYNPKNNPEDPGYDPSAPISILCTGEVKMYEKNEMVSHNSYKLPDSVNSFKWDRKVSIGSTRTLEKFDAWKKMIELRKNSARFDYGQMSEQGVQDNFSMWGNCSENGAIGIYNPNGVHVILGTRENNGTSLSIGQQTFTYSSKNPKKYDSDTLEMWSYSIFVYKLG